MFERCLKTQTVVCVCVYVCACIQHVLYICACTRAWNPKKIVLGEVVIGRIGLEPILQNGDLGEIIFIILLINDWQGYHILFDQPQIETHTHTQREMPGSLCAKRMNLLLLLSALKNEFN